MINQGSPVENNEESIPSNNFDAAGLTPTYPAYVIEGIKDSLKEAANGELTPYTGIRNMLDID
jgi:hypothetical protein